MNKLTKRLYALLTALALLAALAGCGDSSVPSESVTSEFFSAVSEVTSSPDVSEYEASKGVTFADLPNIDTELVYVHHSGDNVLFECVDPGFYPSERTIISYSLTQDKTLGSVTLDSSAYPVTPSGDGGFAVFISNTNTISEYSASCEKLSDTVLTGFTGIDGIELDTANRRALISLNSALYIVSYDGTDSLRVDLPADRYIPLGCADGIFVFSRSDLLTFTVNADGESKEIMQDVNVRYFSNTSTAVLSEEVFAFYSLSDNNAVLVSASDTEEELCGSGSDVFVSAANVYRQSILRVYDPVKSVCRTVTVEGEVSSAAVTDDGWLVAAINGENGFEFAAFYLSTLRSKSFGQINNPSGEYYDHSLPEITGSDELVAMANEALNVYNIKFINAESWITDSLRESEYDVSLCNDRKVLADSVREVMKCLDFLPAEIWRKIGDENPLVVYLCKDITGPPTGLTTSEYGYNIIFIECDPKRWHFGKTFIHEVGHAIVNTVFVDNYSFDDKWLELTPKKVRDAVENGTVDSKNHQYTLLDRNGEVYYVSDYAMTDPEEDRADTFAKLYFDCFVGGRVGVFDSEVIKNKAKLWAEIIHVGFGYDGELSFERYLK